MKVLKMIECVSGLNAFIKKDLEMEYDLRIAATKNYKALDEEYKIYLDAKRKIDEELINKKKSLLGDKPEAEMTVEEKTQWEELRSKAQKKLDKILDTELKVDIIKVSSELTRTMPLSLKEQLALDFMLEENEPTQEVVKESHS